MFDLGTDPYGLSLTGCLRPTAASIRCKLHWVLQNQRTGREREHNQATIGFLGQEGGAGAVTKLQAYYGGNLLPPRHLLFFRRSTPKRSARRRHVVSTRRFFCPIGPPRLQNYGTTTIHSRDVVVVRGGVDACWPPSGGGCVGHHSAVKQEWTENA